MEFESVPMFFVPKNNVGSGGNEQLMASISKENVRHAEWDGEIMAESVALHCCLSKFSDSSITSLSND